LNNVYDYIIIGSGFGGSVSAMRLSEKGYKVLVIEKGKRYEAKDFPKTNWNIRKYFWAPFIRCFGIFKMSFFNEVLIASGVGFGGGSLVYANTHLMPPDKFFNNPIWSHFKEWKKVLMPFYNTAKFMLGSTPNPCYTRKDEVLHEIAKDMNREHTFGSVDVGVYFGDTDKPKDPYFNGLGPERTGCIECSGCIVGCRYNAKNSLDKNYLYFAEKFGAEFEVEKKVERVEYINGEYIVHTTKSTAFLNKKKKTFRSKGIVFSGGVLGTLELLLKQKHVYKTLTGLSDTLGFNLRTNSETLLGITSKKEKLNDGISLTTGFYPDDNTHVEVVSYPNGSNSLKIFTSLAAGPGPSILRALKLLFNIITHPINYLRLNLSSKWAENSVVLVVMQTLDNSMKMVYRSFPWGRMTIKNDNKTPAFIKQGYDTMNKYAKKVDGIPQMALTEVLFNMSTTAHIMGGCPMGKTKAEGIVDDNFRVFGYPDMYILDGSILPCNLGVNPSLTITALSEYAMSNIEEKAGNKNKSLKKQLINAVDSSVN